MKIEQLSSNTFKVEMGTARLHQLRKIGTGYSMKDTTALTAVIHAGMGRMEEQLQKIAAAEAENRRKRQVQSGG